LAPAAVAPAPVVVLTTPNAAPRVLQAPAPATAGPRLSLDVVDYGASGEIRFAGIAPPGGIVRLYVDNRAVGDAAADAQGRWGLVPGAEVPAGDHMLRLDLIGPNGQALARQELPFQRAVIAPVAATPGSAPEAPARVVVQPRQNLWRIARQSYGQGVRYTVIFEANREQIRDPNLIYPGQVFALPASTPASASTSR
jgi:nucleoid-associated protein YgaU